MALTGWILRHAVIKSCNIDHVKDRFQELTKGKQNPNLRGVNLEVDFTLSSTK